MQKHLYDIFAQRWYHGGSVWFYSDPHFNDEEMRTIRKNYISDAEQVKRINRKAGKNDTLIILGDIGDINWVKQLKAGYKVLIMGNHDAGASNYQRVDDNRLFDEVYEGTLQISPKIILSHEPIESLPTWLFNIHGHDHSNWFTGSRHLNVCAEHIDYTPIALSAIVRDGLLKDVEDMHRVTIDHAISRKTKKEGA